jgi:hypothetical protein
MRMSDLFRDMNLAGLGVTALLLFVSVFAGAVLRTFLRRSEDDRRLAHLPLEDDGAVAHRVAHRAGNRVAHRVAPREEQP